MDVETLQIHLNSKNLSQGSINDAYFYINTIEVPSDYQLHLSVLSASIPYSFYSINDKNNTLLLNVMYINPNSNNLGSDNLIMYIIPKGNYTITQFITQLQTIMIGYTISYNKITSKITISYSTDFIILNTSTCLDFIGFGDVDISLLSSINNSITSVNCINLQSQQCICVATNFISHSISIINQKKPTVICCIPINTAPNSMITYVNPSHYKINIYSSMFSMINIKLTDQDGTLIDMNGCHWSMTLQIEIIRFTE